jgi:putative ABC transport system permease protein
VLKNYFKIAFNSIWRNKIFTSINVIGLSVGITAAFFIYSFISFESNYDTFNSKYSRIFRVSTDVQTKDELMRSDKTSAVIAPSLIDEFPEIENYVRFCPHSILGRAGDKKFQENETMFADSTLFSVFDFKLLKGNPKTALSGMLNVVLTASNARKYFGEKDPIGQEMLLGGGAHHAIVTGVVADLPGNSTIKAKMFLSMLTDDRFSPGILKNPFSLKWNTFLVLKEGTDVKAFQKKISDHISKKYGKQFKEEQISQTLVLEPLADVYLRSDRKSESSYRYAHGSQNNVKVFGYIGIFILIIACINFVNLATSRANDRAKEVGIRKVTGATRTELIKQFLLESMIISTLSGFLSLVFVMAAVPVFNHLAGKTIIHSISENKPAVCMILVSSVLIGLISGLYPAFILSQFKPINVLKGKFISSFKGIVMRKALVVFQFTVSITLIIATIVVYKQLTHMKDQELGFKKDQMLVLDYHGEYAGWELINSVRKLPKVISCSLSGDIPGHSAYKDKYKTDLEDPSGNFQSFMMKGYRVDYAFLKQYDIPLLAGRYFDIAHSTDSMEAIILNESAIKKLGYASAEEAIGKRFKQFNNDGMIIGVTRDFHDQSLKEEVEPICYRLLNWNPGTFITINIASGNFSATLDNIKKEWDKFIPHRPIDYFFLDETFDKQYRSEEQFGKLFFIFSLLSILISCLGLVGLVSYHTIQRTKEIGIRKVLGASLLRIVNILSGEYLKLVGISLLIACCVSTILMNKWLAGFASRTSMTATTFVYAGTAALIIALLSISYFTLKAALANPIKSLRTE